MTHDDDKPTITAYPNGPLIVRGDVTILSADGDPVPRRRRTVALCRCGVSTIKPFCDGTHRITGFCTEEPDEAAERDAVTEAADRDGGEVPVDGEQPGREPDRRHRPRSPVT